MSTSVGPLLASYIALQIQVTVVLVPMPASGCRRVTRAIEFKHRLIRADLVSGDDGISTQGIQHTDTNDYISL